MFCFSNELRLEIQFQCILKYNSNLYVCSCVVVWTGRHLLVTKLIGIIGPKSPRIALSIRTSAQDLLWDEALDEVKFDQPEAELDRVNVSLLDYVKNKETLLEESESETNLNNNLMMREALRLSMRWCLINKHQNHSSPCSPALSG